MATQKYSFNFVRGCFKGQRRTFVLDDLGSFAKLPQLMRFSAILDDLRKGVKAGGKEASEYSIEEMADIMQHRFFTDPEIVNAVLRCALDGDHGDIDWMNDTGYDSGAEIIQIMFEFIHAAGKRIKPPRVKRSIEKR